MPLQIRHRIDRLRRLRHVGRVHRLGRVVRPPRLRELFEDWWERLVLIPPEPIRMVEVACPTCASTTEVAPPAMPSIAWCSATQKRW